MNFYKKYAKILIPILILCILYSSGSLANAQIGGITDEPISYMNKALSWGALVGSGVLMVGGTIMLSVFIASPEVAVPIGIIAGLLLTGGAGYLCAKNVSCSVIIHNTLGEKLIR